MWAFRYMQSRESNPNWTATEFVAAIVSRATQYSIRDVLKSQRFEEKICCTIRLTFNDPTARISVSVAFKSSQCSSSHISNTKSPSGWPHRQKSIIGSCDIFGYLWGDMFILLSETGTLKIPSVLPQLDSMICKKTGFFWLIDVWNNLFSNFPIIWMMVWEKNYGADPFVLCTWFFLPWLIKKLFRTIFPVMLATSVSTTLVQTFH